MTGWLEGGVLELAQALSREQGYRTAEPLKRAESTENGGRPGGEERWDQGRAYTLFMGF